MLFLGQWSDSKSQNYSCGKSVQLPRRGAARRYVLSADGAHVPMSCWTIKPAIIFQSWREHSSNPENTQSVLGKWHKAQESTDLPPSTRIWRSPPGVTRTPGMVSWLSAPLLSCSPERFQCFHLLLSKPSIALLRTQLFWRETGLLMAHHLWPPQAQAFSSLVLL